MTISNTNKITICIHDLSTKVYEQEIGSSIQHISIPLQSEYLIDLIYIKTENLSGLQINNIHLSSENADITHSINLVENDITTCQDWKVLHPESNLNIRIPDQHQNNNLNLAFEVQVKAIKDLDISHSNYEKLIHTYVENLINLQQQNNELQHSNNKLTQELQTIEHDKNIIIDSQHKEIKKLKFDYDDQIYSFKSLQNSISTRIGWAITLPVRALFNLISKFTDKSSWLWLELVKAALISPIRMFKHMDKNHLRVLSSAIKREPPQLIIKNLHRKLEGKSPIPINEYYSKGSSKNAFYKKPVKQLKQDIETTTKNASILYVCPNLTEYDTSSGGKRVTRMLELLEEEFEVYIFTLGTKPKKYKEALNQKGIIVIETTDYSYVKKLIPNFHTIIFGWYYTYQESIKFRALYPNAKIIIDSVDVHWVREERSIGIWEGLTEEKVEENKINEIDAYKDAHIVWAVTDNDRQAILKEVPSADVRIVSNIHEPILTQYKDNRQNTILFIGGYNHYPNIYAAKRLVLEILPKVRTEIKDAKVILAGAYAPQEVLELASEPGVTYKGFIKEEDMDELYENSFMTVTPLVAGAGIKGKICESISYMTPVVTNDIGNEGINLENEIDGLITPLEQMHDFIIKAFKREYDFKSMTTKAQLKLSNIVGPSLVKSNMVNSILPKVSICIVTWNKLDMLKRCIDSIIGNTKYPNFEILVYSNGCTDGTQSYLSQISESLDYIKPILSKTNEVFVIPNNKMMHISPDSDVVLLNNDTYVTPNWLNELSRVAYSSENYGVAGSKILYPDGTLQEFGSELYPDGTGRNIGKWQDPDDQAYKKVTEVGYVSGCAMFIKRSTIKRIGVFDEQFHPCYCEDSDYCYTAKEHNLKTVVVPTSIVFHEEGATSGTDTSSGFKKYQEVNMQKFLKKHKKKLKHKEEAILV